MRIPILTRRQIVKACVAIAAENMSGVDGFAGMTQVARNASRSGFDRAAMPSRSDVIMSLRSFRPDGLDQLRAFHATRSEWFYSTDRTYIAEMKKIVSHVGLSLAPATLSNNLPAVYGASPSGAARDVDGSVLSAPWMADHQPWSSIFDAKTRPNIMRWVDDAVRTGADSVQIDDPDMEFGITEWAGGDFSPDAISAFRSYCQTSASARQYSDLAAQNYDMGGWVRHRAGTNGRIDWRAFKKDHSSEPAWLAWTSFMRDTTRDLLGSLRHYLHTLSRPLPLSINRNNPLPLIEAMYLLDCTDYLVSEVSRLYWPKQLLAYHACAAAWQLPFVPSFVPESAVETRWAIALAYSLGDNPLVPWNVFVPGKSRYFGTVAEYGDLFEFVRNYTRYFNDFDEVAEVVFVLDENPMTRATSYALQQTIYLAAMRSLDVGSTFGFAVLRTDQTVKGKHSKPFDPQVAVTINCPTASARAIFPSIPVLELNDFSPGHPALRKTIRILTPDPQKIVAIPRINKRDGTLLIHVVNAAKTTEALGYEHYIDVTLPEAYASLVEGIKNASLFRPHAAPVNVPLSARRDAENLVIRLSLAGISVWGMLVFERV
jgi:hypothetical protein